MEPEQEEGDGVRCGSRSASPAPEQEEGTELLVAVCSGHGGRRHCRGGQFSLPTAAPRSAPPLTFWHLFSHHRRPPVTDAAPTKPALISYSCPCALANRHQE